MTATQRIIEDGIKGGYPKEKTNNYLNSNRSILESSYSMLLDPLFWKAVGKARVWTERDENTFEAEMGCWQANFHGFIDFLISGKSIEDSLLALEQ